MFIESVIGLMLLSLAIFMVPMRYKWGCALAAVSVGVALALCQIVQIFYMGRELVYDQGENIVFGVQYGVVDTLSALFMGIFSIAALAVTIYARGYLAPYLQRKTPLQISLHYFSLVILFLSLLLVVTFRDAFGFLFSWEVMTLSSFLLILFEGERREVRRAAMNYLVLMHAGFMFLLTAFVLLAVAGLPPTFDSIALYGEQHGGVIVLFVLFLIGFGMKAGIFPLHVWLPEAHPAAPAHISAFMSGVMIKAGVYGVIRVVSNLDSDLFVVGLTLLVVGAVTGLWGVIFAALQNDIKKLLAYSSIENIGIIFLGLGLYGLGMWQQNALLAWCGMTGALLHTVNHSFFKALLFMGAGNVYATTHTTSLDALGGLRRKMPVTAVLFLVGVLAICALPPLNGFVSEFMIYLGLLEGIASNSMLTVITLCGLLALALIGGLVVMAFTKLYGVVFSGMPRSEAVEHAHEASRPMLVAMAFPLAGILLVGLLPYVALQAVGTIALPLADASQGMMWMWNDSFLMLNGVVIVLVLFALLIWGIRQRLLRGRRVSESPTWGCGFTAVTPKMQYTGESFSEGLGRISERMMSNRLDPVRIDTDEIFPRTHNFEVKHRDKLDMLFSEWWVSLMRRLNTRLALLRTGKVNHYVLYALLFLALVFVLSIFNLI